MPTEKEFRLGEIYINGDISDIIFSQYNASNKA